MFVDIKDFKNHAGREITVRGWMFNKRSSGKIAFLQFRDGSGIVQGVIVEKEAPEAFRIAHDLFLEASLEVTGKVSQHPRQSDQFELQISAIKIIQNPTGEYPIGKKEHGPDFLLDNRHLWLRSQKQAAIQRVRHTAIYAIYEFFDSRGFTKIDTPIFTPNACEGTTTLFEIDYFDLGKVYLAQSGQLYLEAAIASFGKVFDFGPVFRAEKSKTRRHLTEFWMMDAEMAFYDHKMNMDLQEEMIIYIVEKVLERNLADLTLLERDLKDLENTRAPFYRIAHKDAVKKLRDAGHEQKENDDFGAEQEIALANMFDRPVFVEKYPVKVKAFYMKRDPDDEEHALCSDLLVRSYGELIGGSQREDDYETLLKRLREHNLNEEDFKWYLGLRKFGSVPHSGFGIGLERTVTWLCGLQHVRESIPFPRMIHRKTP